MNTSSSHTRKFVILAVAIIFVAIISWLVLSSSKKTGADTVLAYIVGTHDVVSSVSIPATVKPVRDVDLSFNRTGVIGSVAVGVGDKVTRGEVLASLEHADLSASLAQAKANLDAEKAKLASLERGSRPEDIAVAQASLDQANTSAQEAGNVLSDKTRASYTSADDALHDLAGALFTNPDTESPKLSFQTSESKTEIELESARVTQGHMLDDWQTQRDANGTAVPSGEYVGTVEADLRQLISFFDLLSKALTNAVPDSINTSTVLAGYRTNVALARTNLNTALSNVVAAEQTYANAESAATVAERQLELKKAGTLPEDIAAEEARVASAEASLESADAELAKTEIVAPFSGTVTKADAKVGAAAAPNVPLISLISSNDDDIEGYLSEVDVAKVHVNDEADITLDAYGTGQIFKGSVTSIDPSPALVNGAPAYKATFEIDKTNDPGIKPGMNANVSIVSDKKTGVVAVPNEAIITRMDKTYVEAITGNGTTELREVKTGLKGNDLTEITSGLSEGMKINSFTNAAQ